MFHVSGPVTNIKPRQRWVDGVKTDEIIGGILQIGSKNEGIALRVEVEMIDFLPSIGDRVKVAARRNYWKDDKGDWHENYVFMAFEFDS
jgi:hypothetical protein